MHSNVCIVSWKNPFIKVTHLTITTRGTFGCRTISNTIATCSIKAEKLCTNAFIFEACWRASISSTLCIECKESSWKLSPEGFIFMRSIMQTACSISTTTKMAINYFVLIFQLNKKLSTWGNDGNFERCMLTIWNLALYVSDLT